MSVCTVRISLLSLALSIAACSSVPGAGTTPPAGTLPVSTSAGEHFLFQKLSIQPRAGAPATLMNFVSAGPAQKGVPCISCVSGAGSDTIGLSGPSSYIPTGAVWQYSLSFTDIAYKGSCKLSWTIKAGSKLLDSFGLTLNLKSSGGWVLYALNRDRPSYSGPATLTGNYACGKSTGSAHAPLEFE